MGHIENLLIFIEKKLRQLLFASSKIYRTLLYSARVYHNTWWRQLAPGCKKWRQIVTRSRPSGGRGKAAQRQMGRRGGRGLSGTTCAHAWWPCTRGASNAHRQIPSARVCATRLHPLPPKLSASGRTERFPNRCITWSPPGSND